VPAFLAELKEVLGDRPAVLAREITKIHEEFIRGPLTRIIELLEERPEVKGECTLLVAGAPPAAPDPRDLDAAIADALARSDDSLSTLAKELARLWSVPRKEVYARALALKAAGRHPQDQPPESPPETDDR
jgi:16S rRNA (cytidine1402-2'-O)-methyltransferase